MRSQSLAIMPAKYKPVGIANEIKSQHIVMLDKMQVTDIDFHEYHKTMMTAACQC